MLPGAYRTERWALKGPALQLMGFYSRKLERTYMPTNTRWYNDLQHTSTVEYEALLSKKDKAHHISTQTALQDTARN